jgi:hypothetical protein
MYNQLDGIVQFLYRPSGAFLVPYSKPLGLIFVAIPKTGSSSLVRALKTLQDPSGQKLQLLQEFVDKPYRKRYRFDEIGDPNPGRAKHLSALQIRYVLGEEEFDRCIKFSVVRNPWSRMLSRYFFTHVDAEPIPEKKRRRHTRRAFHNLDFESWLIRRWRWYQLVQFSRKVTARRGNSEGRLSIDPVGRFSNNQVHKLVDFEGRLLVDHIGRLEHVQDTLDWVCRKIGVDYVEMPHVNGARRGDYASFYNDRTREMVEEMCREDIEYFNYQFE